MSWILLQQSNPLYKISRQRGREPYKFLIFHHLVGGILIDRVYTDVLALIRVFVQTILGKFLGLH